MAEEMTLNVKKHFLDYLECPVCKEYMSGYIHLCIGGHSLCMSCKDKVNVCPCCKEPFSSGRNFTLEKMVESISLPCINVDFGCKDLILLSNKVDHEKTCRFRMYKCIPGKKSGCSWQGRSWEILDHDKQEHDSQVFTNLKNFAFITECFSMTADLYSYNFLSFNNNLFLFNTCFKYLQKTYYVSIHYIGPVDPVESDDYIGAVQNNYMYEISLISSKNSKQRIVFCMPVHADHVEMDDLISQRACFCVSFDVGKQFMTDDKLKYTIDILENS